MTYSDENTFPLPAYVRNAIVIWRWSNARHFVTICSCKDTDTFKSLQDEWRKHGKTVVDVTFVQKEGDTQ